MQNEALIKHLKKIGLSEKSSLIYATLIEMGGCFPSRLAEITHINRSTVYKILLDLSIKGLITEIEKGKKLFYQPENPDKLLRYTKMQAEIANDAHEKTQELMPDIEGIFAMNPNKPKIRYFQNAEGIASIYEDMVSGKDKYEMISFSHGQAFKNFLPAKDLYKFVKAKESLGITTKAIIPDTPENRKYNEEVFDGIEKKFWPNIKFISAEKFPFEVEVTMYGNNKTSFTKLNGNHLMGIIIEDEIIYKVMKMIFEISWNSNDVAN